MRRWSGFQSWVNFSQISQKNTPHNPSVFLLCVLSCFFFCCVYYHVWATCILFQHTGYWGPFRASLLSVYLAYNLWLSDYFKNTYCFWYLKSFFCVISLEIYQPKIWAHLPQNIDYPLLIILQKHLKIFYYLENL